MAAGTAALVGSGWNERGAFVLACSCVARLRYIKSHASLRCVLALEDVDSQAVRGSLIEAGCI